MKTDARRTDPRTSKEAGDRVDEFRHLHCVMILNALERGPGTKDEIANRTKELTEQQVARRLHGLQSQGYVEPTGETRPTPSGRAARVWRLAPQYSREQEASVGPGLFDGGSR